MSLNQLHGKKFEDFIKATFQGASDSGRTNTSKWDIESRFDKVKFVSSNIKTTGSLKIDMADARAFIENTEGFRLIVGLYKQIGKYKEFYEIREYYITDKILHSIKGDLTLGEVEKYHNDLKKIPRNFSKNDYALYVKANKKTLQDKKTILKLNPKVSKSGNQRRLQCSLNLTELESIKKSINDFEFYTYKEEYREVVLPIKILSSPREFKNKNID